MAIPQTMKAAILVEQRKPLVIDEVQLPQSLEIGQVLVKVHFSGICGSQVGEIDGAKGEDKFLPHLLGHEGSATVMEVGPGVRHVVPGDVVVLHWRKGLGIESVPAIYGWRGNKLNAGWITTFNEYAIVSENRMTPIPSDSDLEMAALFGCAVTTGFGVIENNAKVRIGESVVVFGAGGVGLNIVQAASLVGAYPVIAVDLFDNRLDLAKLMGATHLINSKKNNAREAIERISGVAGLDVFVDNTGNPAIIGLGYELVNPQGRVTLVGVPRKGSNISIYTLPLHFGKGLSGSHGGETIPEKDINRYLSFIKNKNIKLREVITEITDIYHINDAIERIVSGAASGRILVRFN
jgi:S-(hydroxymethyl)glutathione dehydrogenase/alcohol dehydrogenase